MKNWKAKGIAFLLAVSMCLLCFLNVGAEETLDLYSTYCSVIDSKTGRILYQKNGLAQVPMASTTKILTCILILENGNLNDYAVTSKYAASMPKVHMGAKKDEYYKVEDLLYALMLESYNDAAVILAEYLCEDIYRFADLMNEKATEIGCEKYNFITANGLDNTNDNGEHSISATDLAKIMAYCTTISPKKEDFLKITTTQSHTVYAYKNVGEEYKKNGRSIQCTNRNTLLSYSGVLSGKTGFTNKAGYCYVCQAEVNERQISFSLLACGWPNNRNYKWSDSKKIINYIRENYSDKEIKYPQVKEITAPIILNEKKQIDKTAQNRLSLKLSEDSNVFFMKEEDRMQYIFNISETISAPVKEGEIVGELRVYINEELVDTVTIFSAVEVEENTYKNCIQEVLKNFICKIINI